MKGERELQAAVVRIRRHAERKEFPEALALCNQLLAAESSRPAGLRERADLFATARQYERALEDRRALVLINPVEPADLFDLGVLALKLGNTAEAADAFVSALRIGGQEGFHAYDNAARIHLIVSLSRLGKLDAARSEAQLVPAGATSYVSGMGLVDRAAVEKLLLSGTTES